MEVLHDNAGAWTAQNRGSNEMDPLLAAIDALIPNMQRLANKSGRIDRFYRLTLVLVNRL